MKRQIKKILTDKNLWIFTAITLIFFGVLIRMEFAVDSYATLTFSNNEFITQFASSGRFMLAIIGIILRTFHLKYENIYMVSYLSAVICMIISLYKLNIIIKEEVKTEILQVVIPILIVLNIFSLELFLFIEKGIMLFGVMMSVFAAGEIKMWLKNKNKKYLFTTFLFMILGNFSYQGVVGIFVAIGVIYIIKYSKNVKEFIINNIVVTLSYGIPAIIDYILIKIFYSASRVSGEFILSKSLEKIYTSTIDMIKNTYNMFPKYMFLIMILSIIGLIIYQIIIKKDNIKNKVLDALKIVYIIFAVIFASIAPQIMQNTASIWFVARSTYVYASLFGILILYLYTNFDNVKVVTTDIVIMLSVIILITQFCRFNLIETARYKTNEMDYENTRKVISKIKEYEEETGNKILNIALYEDKSISYTYYGIFSTGDTNVKAYSKDWSIIYIIKYYSGINLKKIDKNPEIEKKFKENDWNTFENEQLIFEGDTLHLCKY